jgi:hypothetical protein
MATKITAKVKISPAFLKKIDSISNVMNKTTATKVGEEVVDQIKTFTAGGVSPIAGNGKFPAYKDPKIYPGDRKPKSPVNLRLSGDFMSSLRATTKPDGKDYVAVVSYPGNENKKEQGHRDGANSQPKRPTLPVKGETFAEKIKAAYTKIIEDRIDKLAKG